MVQSQVSRSMVWTGIGRDGDVDVSRSAACGVFDGGVVQPLLVCPLVVLAPAPSQRRQRVADRRRADGVEMAPDRDQAVAPPAHGQLPLLEEVFGLRREGLGIAGMPVVLAGEVEAADALLTGVL